ncbi:periplasmic binding protein-like I [Blastocladiella britannica]|nr:periplasmic binding protein-like I [Blastocladiella britannica]
MWGTVPLLLALGLFSMATIVHGGTINLAVHLPFANTSISDVAQIKNALQLVQSDLNLLDPNRQTTFNIIYTPTDLSLAAASSAFHNDRINSNVLGIIGDYYSSYTQPAALEATFFNIYMCSGSATNDEFSSDDYLFFYRMIASDTSQGIMMATMVKSYGWKRVNLLFPTGSDHGTVPSLHSMK